jgi:L-alanine-DL-glutamate epimerase-like enolase superfamily enzyme
MLNMASQQLAAAVFDCPRMECAAGADRIPWAIKNPIVIKDGYMEVSNDPGLGVELNQEYLRANRQRASHGGVDAGSRPRVHGLCTRQPFCRFPLLPI